VRIARQLILSSSLQTARCTIAFVSRLAMSYRAVLLVSMEFSHKKRKHPRAETARQRSGVSNLVHCNVSSAQMTVDRIAAPRGCRSFLHGLI
jgi:hypothetical protein